LFTFINEKEGRSRGREEIEERRQEERERE
jgi:hypothetical protein